MRLRPAVFLDRDDTLNVNADLPEAAWDSSQPGDLLDPTHARLSFGAGRALARLKDAGFALIVITNQGGVARAHGSVRDVERVHDALRSQLPTAEEGMPAALDPLIDAWYCCPFHPSGIDDRFSTEHTWRKPGPGMIEAAAEELRLDLSRSWLIGDAERDAAAGRAAGIEPSRCLLLAPVGSFESLASAAEHVVRAGAGASKVVAASRVTLRAAVDGPARPLADEQARATVLATARALAERTGVELLDLSADAESLTAVLAASRLAALGFAAELRRATNEWHARRAGVPLWDEAG
jgi:histidinol-phosphate phosphatase family protein